MVGITDGWYHSGLDNDICFFIGIDINADRQSIYPLRLILDTPQFKVVDVVNYRGRLLRVVELSAGGMVICEYKNPATFVVEAHMQNGLVYVKAESKNARNGG